MSDTLSSPVRNVPAAANAEGFERRLIGIRPLLVLPIPFAVGVWLSHHLALPFQNVILLTLFLLCLIAFHVSSRWFIPFTVIAFFILGFLFGTNDRTVADRHIGLIGPGGPMILEGVVSSVPETAKQGKKETVSFILRSNRFYRFGSRYETEGKVQVFLHNPKRQIRFGDALKLKGTLDDPARARNPYSFNYQKYLAEQGIFKVFRGFGFYTVLFQEPAHAPPWLMTVNRFRMYLKHRLDALFRPPNNALAKALLLGFRKDIPRNIRDEFVLSGTAHLLAISGLHVSLIGGVIYLCSGLLRMPGTARLILTVLVILLYILVAGANIPVLRAGIMGTVILLGLVFGYERNLKSAFFFGLFLLLLWDPSVLFQASFQLSFGAVAALIFFLPKLESTPKSQEFTRPQELFFGTLLLARLFRFTQQTFLASVTVTLVIFPMVSWYFHLFSLVGLLANLVVIPVTFLGMVSTLVVLVLDWIWTPFAAMCAAVPSFFYDLELWLVGWFARVPFGNMSIPSPPWHFFVLYYGFLIAWVATDRKPVAAWLRSALLCSLILVVALFLTLTPLKSARMVIFDLGRSDSAFITFRNRSNCLINSGPRFPQDQSYWVLTPFLMGSGVRHLDSVFVTKLKASHVGAFRTLAARYPPKHLWLPKDFRAQPAWEKYLVSESLKKSSVHGVSNGSVIQFGSDGQSHMEVLAAEKSEILAFFVRDVDMSVFYVASARPRTFEILSARSELKADLLFLPHHDQPMTKIEREVLMRIAPKWIVSNQRNADRAWLTELGSHVNAQIVMLEQSGAIEFYEAQGAWRCRTHVQRQPDFAYLLPA